MSIASLDFVPLLLPESDFPPPMRLLHQSPLANRDSIVIGQHIFFACGMSRTVRRTGALRSEHDSRREENWKSGSEPGARTRLAGCGQIQPHLAESVSATQGTCPACSGSTTARRRGR